METLRRLIDQTSAQLKLLNPSQKIAIALCVVIIGGSLGWLLSWSTTPEYVALLPQDMSLEQLDEAEAALAEAGVHYQIRGKRIYVPMAEQSNSIRVLNRKGALPEDTSIGFQELIADDSPFRPSKENDRRFEIALGNELAKVIASSPDVEKARVFIQSEMKRRLTGPATVPTGSVYVSMRRGQKLTQQAAESFARLVSGAVPGLEAHRVEVIDGHTHRRLTVADPENAWATDMLDRVKQNEQHLIKKIHEHLSYIPGVLAAVTVELDHSKKRTQKATWADPTPKSEESENSKTNSASRSGEPGTNPNVGIALDGGSLGASSEEKRTSTDFYEANPSEIIDAEIIPGAIMRTTAAINVPRSFVVSIFKAQPGNEDTEPTDGDPVFETIRKQQQDLIRDGVKNIIQAESDDDVRVSTFYDFDPATGALGTLGGGAAVAGVGQGGEYAEIASEYGPEAGMIVLALFALFMLFMMVRRSTKAAAAIPTPAGPSLLEDEAEYIAGEDGIIHLPGGVVGDAEMPDGMLMGQEVNEDALRFKQLGEQVSRMVDENPQIAADLLKRWVETE
jgi:flagellar biosynthesis/type III secretory pathway M-ring protein FliF/YscJ